MTRVGPAVDEVWRRLATYRQRYQIEDRLGPIVSLETSMTRRHMRAATLSRRLEELIQQIVATRAELRAVQDELDGSRAAGALLIEEIIDQVRLDMGETWSPRPVRGFRVWRIEDHRVIGNQIHWPSSTLVAECLRKIPGEDLPHSAAECGPPSCGIYAVKSLDMFPEDVARGKIHRSVVGVVAMTGKVVEHEHGYRSQTATAIAVSANDGRHVLVTHDPYEISALFADPVSVLADAPPIGDRHDDQTRDFLGSVKSMEDQWI